MKDSTAAILVSFSLFVFPSKNPLSYFRKSEAIDEKELTKTEENRPSSSLLAWKTAQSRIAWDVILLIGAGLALARACEVSF